jgi:hypothetical protein
MGGASKCLLPPFFISGRLQASTNLSQKGLAVTATHQSAQFAPLESVTRPTVTTREAAFYLNRRPQTLRCWASEDDGPLRPVRVLGPESRGPLAWPVAEIKRLLGIAG